MHYQPDILCENTDQRKHRLLTLYHLKVLVGKRRNWGKQGKQRLEMLYQPDIWKENAEIKENVGFCCYII